LGRAAKRSPFHSSRGCNGQEPLPIGRLRRPVTRLLGSVAPCRMPHASAILIVRQELERTV
jgi:hypothetical protein